MLFWQSFLVLTFFFSHTEKKSNKRKQGQNATQTRYILFQCVLRTYAFAVERARARLHDNSHLFIRYMHGNYYFIQCLEFVHELPLFAYGEAVIRVRCVTFIQPSYGCIFVLEM